MSKRESISRYSLIIKKLRRTRSSLKEILDYLKLESELQEYDFTSSNRTFQRDLNDIRSIYNIDIQYDYSSKVYYLEEDDLPEVSVRLLEAYDTFNALNVQDRLSEYIHFEVRKPMGTENLFGLLHAIRNNFQIAFTYKKFADDIDTERTCNPYALKEFKNRWYVIASDLKDTIVKSFSLDRLNDLKISKLKFIRDNSFDVHHYYQHYFGIEKRRDEKVQEVIISFPAWKGKYIKSLPFHESQVNIVDNADELRIRLSLVIEHDFIMELLSHSPDFKVIQPEPLMEEIKEIYKQAARLYSND